MNIKSAGIISAKYIKPKLPIKYGTGLRKTAKIKSNDAKSPAFLTPIFMGKVNLFPKSPEISSIDFIISLPVIERKASNARMLLAFSMLNFPTAAEPNIKRSAVKKPITKFPIKFFLNLNSYIT